MNWYYADAGQQVGPIGEAELDALAQSGKIQPSTLVWRDGMKDWIPYAQIKAGGDPEPAELPPAASAGVNCLRRMQQDFLQEQRHPVRRRLGLRQLQADLCSEAPGRSDTARAGRRFELRGVLDPIRSQIRGWTYLPRHPRDPPGLCDFWKHQKRRGGVATRIRPSRDPVRVPVGRHRRRRGLQYVLHRKVCTAVARRCSSCNSVATSLYFLRSLSAMRTAGSPTMRSGFESSTASPATSCTV